MTRILITLASVSLALLGAALLLGLSIGDVTAPQTGGETLGWLTWHRLTGIAAALVVVFVESVIVTYFIGTSRWCKEVVETYQLDRGVVRESNRLKRRTFPWALAGMLVVVGVISLGAAADTTAPPQRDQWAQWHLAAAIAGIAFIGWTYLVAWNNIAANHAIIERLMAAVQRIRRERGLNGEANDKT